MANSPIIEEIRAAIESLEFGSVEVIVQNGEITQISTRIIKKTNVKETSQKVARALVQKRGGSGININFKY